MFVINGNLETETIDGQPDVVITAPWACVYEEESVVGELIGKTSFTYDPSASFTPYDELTEAQVVQWITTTLGPDAVAFYETKTQETVQNAIAVAKEEGDRLPRKIFITAVYTPVQNKPAPWATPV